MKPPSRPVNGLRACYQDYARALNSLRRASAFDAVPGKRAAKQRVIKALESLDWAHAALRELLVVRYHLYTKD